MSQAHAVYLQHAPDSECVLPAIPRYAFTVFFQRDVCCMPILRCAARLRCPPYIHRAARNANAINHPRTASATIIRRYYRADMFSCVPYAKPILLPSTRRDAAQA